VSTVDSTALRFALAASLALACAYGSGMPLPFLAPLFTVFLAAAPGPPPGPKQSLMLLLVMVLALSVGLLLSPLLVYYPASGVALVALGLFLANSLVLVAGKRIPGLFLTVGFTFISIAGVMQQALASVLILALALALATALLALWIAHAVFPVAGVEEGQTETGIDGAHARWLALRTTLVVMPAYLLALTNPSQYLMTIMKSVSLGQQASLLDLRHAGRELIGSTFAGGIMAVLFWCLLKLSPSLWMFTLWMGAFSLYAAAKMLRLLPSGMGPGFWLDALITMLILLGPAVQDSASGKDPLTASLVRFATFIAVTVYAWAAIIVLERGRRRRLARSRALP
jgi:hypothetical protein